ncbi:MAG: phosphatase domain-containing protein [Bacteriovoracaceae bacterium]
MKRPQIVNILAIDSGEHIYIRSSIALLSGNHQSKIESAIFSPSKPWDARFLLKGRIFSLKVVGCNDQHEVIYHNHFDSDSFGNFFFKIPSYIGNQKTDLSKKVHVINLYETYSYTGLEILLGNFYPLKIPISPKIVISDFDKTLVDTQFETLKELYYSLTHPIIDFPPVSNSIEIFKKYTDETFQPFILSASPHFYERSIRDWLYQHNIYTAGIFLKDYRNFINLLLSNELVTKDIKNQGFYKLNHLLTIISMTGIPSELVLMGDNRESDHIIYSFFAEMLKKNSDPWKIWNKIKQHELFTMTNKQSSKFLTQMYQIHNVIKTLNFECKTTIFIRNINPENQDQALKEINYYQ